MTALFGCSMAGPMWNCCCSVYTIQLCTSLQCHFIQSHIGRVHVCLAVTCHLHVCQNNEDLLCATAQKVDSGEEISPITPVGTQTANFQLQVWHSNHWAIHAHHVGEMNTAKRWLTVFTVLSQTNCPYLLVVWKRQIYPNLHGVVRWLIVFTVLSQTNCPYLLVVWKRQVYPNLHSFVIN